MYIHMYIMYLLWHAEPCVIHQNRKYINMNIMIYRCIYIYVFNASTSQDNGSLYCGHC